jgi:hypothetical protein
MPTVAVDSSTPVIRDCTGSSVISNTFSPPANSLLMAYLVSPFSAAVTATDSLGSHLNWTQKSSEIFGGECQAEVWIADCPSAQTNMTVSFTGFSGTNCDVGVIVLTGASTVAGQTGDTDVTGSFGSTGSLTLTTTADNSLCFGFAGTRGSTPTPVAGSGLSFTQGGQNQLGQVTGAGSDYCFCLGTTSLTPTAGTNVTVNWTTLSTEFAFTAVEILSVPPPTPQTLAPISDIQVGTWTPSTGSTLYQTVDDSSGGSGADADYIISGLSPVSPDVAIMGLTPANNPGVDNDGANHHVKYRVGKDSTGGDQITVVVKLMMGTTQIASWTHNNVDAMTEFDQTLTNTQANNITDYSTLRIRVESTSP